MSPATAQAEFKSADQTVSLSEPQSRKGLPLCEKGLQKYVVVLFAVSVEGHATSSRLYHSYATTIVDREMSAGAALPVGEGVGDGDIVVESEGVPDGESEGVPDGVNDGVIEGGKAGESREARLPRTTPHATAAIMTARPRAQNKKRFSEHADGADIDR